MMLPNRSISKKDFQVGDTIFLYSPTTNPFSWASVVIAFLRGGPCRLFHVGKIINVDPVIVGEARYPAGVKRSDINDFLEGGTRFFQLMRYRNQTGYKPHLGVAWMNQVLQDSKAREYDTFQIFANLLNIPWFDDPNKPVCSTFVYDFDVRSGRVLCSGKERWKIKPNDLAADPQLQLV